MVHKPKTRKHTDWRKRYQKPASEKLVLLHTDFAGIKSGQTMLIATPPIIANYIEKIPRGESRTISRMRNELARNHKADATCPVTTAIYLRVVAEKSLMELSEGKTEAVITPFWRVVEADSKIAKKLAVDPDWIAMRRASEGL